MSYRLDHQDLGRVAREQLDQAQGALDDAKVDRQEAIHEARKCIKRTRALLRLARAALGEEIYRRENAALRDAARELSALRDVEALVETYDRLHARYAAEFDWRKLGGVRRALTARRQRLARGPGLPGKVAAFRDQLHDVRGRLSSWPRAKVEFDAQAPGLGRSYRRGRKAMGAIEDAPRDDDFHEWRKRVKYHRHHLELLRHVWPAGIKTRRAEVRKLGRLLGDDHDLSVLRATLGAEGEHFGEGGALLIELAGRRQAELRAQMWPQGLRLYAERPKHLVRRFGLYWRAWQTERDWRKLDEAA